MRKLMLLPAAVAAMVAFVPSVASAAAPVGGLSTSSGDTTAAAATVTLTVDWAGAPEPGTVTVTVDSATAQIADLTLLSGLWLGSCTGGGTASISCTHSNASDPVQLRAVITFPQGTPTGTYTVSISDGTNPADEVFFGVTGPAATTTAAPTTAAPTTAAPTTTAAGQTTTTAIGSGGGSATTAPFELPATGGDTTGVLAMFAFAALVTGGALVASRRRPTA